MKNINYNNCTLGQALDALLTNYKGAYYIASHAQPNSWIALDSWDRLMLIDDSDNIFYANELLTYINHYKNDTWFIGQ